LEQASSWLFCEHLRPPCQSNELPSRLAAPFSQYQIGARLRFGMVGSDTPCCLHFGFTAGKHCEQGKALVSENSTKNNGPFLTASNPWSLQGRQRSAVETEMDKSVYVKKVPYAAARRVS
jgi:hypothetical protein